MAFGRFCCGLAAGFALITLGNGVAYAQDAKAQAGPDAQARHAALVAATEKPVDDAEALMKAGKAAEAYGLLEPLEFEKAGDKRFDYLLGIAALDSGRPDKATIAFERVIAVDPNFAGARLDMARAYFQLGDLPRAKTEFDTVMKQNPPEAARVTIQKYLDAMAAHEKALQTRITAYLEGSVGRDTNINSSTSQGQIPIPVFGNLVFTLSQANISMADSYAGIAMGGEVTHSISPKLALYAGVDLRQRGYTSESQFDTVDLLEHAGVSYTTGEDTFRAGLLGDQYMLSTTRLYNTAGVNGEWRHMLSPGNQLSMFGQFSSFRFDPDSMRIQDFDQSVVGAGWMHVMPDGKSALFGSIFVGHEKSVAPVTAINPTGGRADGNKDMTGLRFGTQVMLNDKWDFFESIGFQWARYDKANAAFLVTRDDRQTDVTLGLNWHFDKLWTVRPQLALSSNDSNIAIYRYHRADVSVAVRRDF
ncbi:conserved exported protein of unknown function [Georgfuchsia toluolica]|uniref:Surface lipoprotein assembly modifier C-terminal domain-containing protein n=1 Tax=Georgfuchsia toluolica TaxID=424218 RepID=A0A916MZP9_9PROT|nr:tetratricopeptide repeat protein [Georgfuchsia toluolica]CAG4883148.1 conserved exported protein of unknown function [Georgfuchsia toluolica]